MKTKTAKDVLVEYQVKYQFKDADLMDLFFVSRQMVWKYLTGRAVPSADRLMKIAADKAGEWEGKMALDVLKARGITIANFNFETEKAVVAA
ncbi:MAG: helix-turn-helix transcriptional regulator [Chloroflexi bacterium]|nr:helix-turn-helix transcriptional regulator [Chloroflexota bacterium]